MLAAVNLDGCAFRLLSISGVIHIKKYLFIPMPITYMISAIITCASKKGNLWHLALPDVGYP